MITTIWSSSWSDYPHYLIIIMIPPAIQPLTATCLFQLKTLLGFPAPHFDTLVQRLQWQQGCTKNRISDVCNKVDTQCQKYSWPGVRGCSRKTELRTRPVWTRIEWNKQGISFIWVFESFYLETIMLHFQKKEHPQESQQDRNKSISHLQESPRQEESNATGEGEQLLGDNE